MHTAHHDGTVIWTPKKGEGGGGRREQRRKQEGREGGTKGQENKHLGNPTEGPATHKHV